MAEKKFAIKEALMHGINMTKKYFMVAMGVGIISVIFNVTTGILENRAGKSYISPAEIERLNLDPAGAKQFLVYLFEVGYIDEKGRVQQKLQIVTNSSELILPPLAVEKDRETIYVFLNQFRYRLPFPKEVYYFLSIILWVFSMLLAIGFLKIALKLSRDQKPHISELISNGSYLVSYILGSICYALAVIGGMILLIIPGIILMVMLQMYPYLIIDKNMGPLEALKRSREITKGSRVQLCVFGLILLLFNMAGLLCLVVGLFFTMPASAVAMAYIYDRLENQLPGFVTANRI